MGLIYQFPIDDNEQEIKNGRVHISKATPPTLTLKTYGLPMIFWGYLAAILTVWAAMALGSKDILLKMFTYDDQILKSLATLVTITLIISPVILLGFYFYEKFLIKKNDQLFIVHRLFFIPFFKKSYLLESNTPFFIDHYLDSPNIAKKLNQKELKGFENKGYFILKANTQKGIVVAIDRLSQKKDLHKLSELLNKY